MTGLADRHIGFTPKRYAFLLGTCGRYFTLFPWNFLNSSSFRLIDPVQLLAGKDVMIFLTGDGQRSQSSFIKSPKNSVIHQDKFTKNIGIKLINKRPSACNKD